MRSEINIIYDILLTVNLWDHDNKFYYATEKIKYTVNGLIPVARVKRDYTDPDYDNMSKSSFTSGRGRVIMMSYSTAKTYCDYYDIRYTEEIEDQGKQRYGMNLEKHLNYYIIVMDSRSTIINKIYKKIYLDNKNMIDTIIRKQILYDYLNQLYSTILGYINKHVNECNYMDIVYTSFHFEVTHKLINVYVDPEEGSLSIILFETLGYKDLNFGQTIALTEFISEYLVKNISNTSVEHFIVNHNHALPYVRNAFDPRLFKLSNRITIKTIIEKPEKELKDWC